MAGRVWRRPPPHALAVDAVMQCAAALVPAAGGARGDEWLVAGHGRRLEVGQRRVGVLAVVAARVRRGRRAAAGGSRRTAGKRVRRLQNVMLRFIPK